MKKIKILNNTYEYKIFVDSLENGENYWTEFYQGTITKKITRKRYILFGETITKVKVEPKLIFIALFNIEDETLTKNDVKERLERKVELINRKQEIANGYII